MQHQIDFEKYPSLPQILILNNHSHSLMGIFEGVDAMARKTTVEFFDIYSVLRDDEEGGLYSNNRKTRH